MAAAAHGGGALLPRSSVFRVPPTAHGNHGLGPLLLEATTQPELVEVTRPLGSKALPLPGEKAGGVRDWKTKTPFGRAVGT